MKENIIRLNIGSGFLPLPGYKNIDIKNTEPCYGVDLVADIRELKKHFKDNSVDEIFAKDSLEHVSWRQVPQTLQSWVDILKPGGVLKIRVPDMDRIMDEYFVHRNDNDAKNRFMRMQQLLFGDQDFVENTHLSAFRREYLVEDLGKLGMGLIQKPWYDGGRDLRLSMMKGEGVSLVSADHPDYQYKEFNNQAHRAMYYSRNS
jgi:predicted SAM-dependent methyltransferase